MTEDQSHIRITEDGDICIVDFLDRKVLEEFTINQIGDQIAELVERRPNPKILICFEEVDHLSSAALGILIKLQNKVEEREGRLILSDIRPQIFEVFRITRLNTFFDIHDTKEDALRSF